MTRDEAKEILLRHRPGVGDESDPEVASALAFAREDAELGEWLTRHSGFQKSVGSALKSIPVPKGLKESILAGHAAPKNVVWLRPAVWLAAAAAVAIIVTWSVWNFSPREDTGFAGFRDRMVRNALRDYRMDLLTNDLVQIRAFLRDRNVQGDYELTDPLSRLPGYGCAALRWQNHDVAMICFDLGGGKPLYLFVAAAAEVPDSPTTSAFDKTSRLTTASWVKNGKVYVLAAEEDEATLRGFL